MAEAPEQLSFLTFLRGMANEALMQLGVIPNPLTGERGVQLPYAKATVRILELLAEKTKGNLSSEESDYLVTVLANLRQRLAKAEAEAAGATPA